MKKLSFLKIMVAVMALFLFISARGADKSFTLSMALQNVGKNEFVSFSSPVESSTGERFRLVIQSDTDCYCYVIAETADGDVVVLLAGLLQGKKVWVSPEIALSLPGGTETFFVAASRDEPSALTKSVTAYKNNTGPTQRRALMNEVFRLRSEISKFKETPEKPVLMGGASRGDPGKNEGMEFSGMDTYVKTIIIEH